MLRQSRFVAHCLCRQLAAMAVLACFAACRASSRQNSPDVTAVDLIPQNRDAAVGPSSSASSSPNSPRTDAACSEYHEGRKGRHPGFSAVDSHPEQFRAFLEGLKKAVAADSKEDVASFIDFPLGDLSRDQFLRGYSLIMTPCLKQSVRCTTVESVAEDHLGAWFASDALLAELTGGAGDRFLITRFTGEGPCYRKSNHGSDGGRSY